jgi:hypothetical protein
VANLSIGVAGHIQDGSLATTGTLLETGGELTVEAGAGGTGGTSGKGGTGGSLVNSTLGCADTFQDYGLLLEGGAGGNGAVGGGAGGNVISIQLNSPQNPTEGIASLGFNNSYDGLSTLILAGNGGNATGAAGAGGAGGSVIVINESKDVGTSINLIQAGNGGNAVKTGGPGGIVTAVKTVGLIGQASDDAGYLFGAFQTLADPATFGAMFPMGVPEGVFAGRGGAAATNGVAGSVTGISAAAIAAIGANADSNGIFAAAEKVAGITAEYIGFSAEGLTTYQGISPGIAQPTDGFIFSVDAPTGINGTVLTNAVFA